MLISGGRLVDPSQEIDALRDIRLREAVVFQIGEHLTPEPGEQSIDARGCYVAPGFIDMHVHLRDPGYTEKETLETGSRAAAAGGFTAVACMPNTAPALDTPHNVRSILERARGLPCRVYPIAALTRDRGGRHILDYTALAAAGAVGFSDDGNTVMDSGVLRDAALAARNVGGRIIAHCEDTQLKRDGVMTEGAASRSLNLPASPTSAEDVMTSRDLILARETGKAWHLAHVSTGAAVDMIDDAKSKGVDVTCEVTPHHLLCTDGDVEALGSAAKVNPPLRGEVDTAALRAAARAGRVDVFASDHAPHTAAEKSGDLLAAAVGFSGLEVAVGAYHYALPDLSATRFVAMLSTNPARIVGQNGGTLRVGSVADITIFADRRWVVNPVAFASKGRCTPFAGRTFARRSVATIVGGELVFDRMAG